MATDQKVGGSNPLTHVIICVLHRYDYTWRKSRCLESRGVCFFAFGEFASIMPAGLKSENCADRAADASKRSAQYPVGTVSWLNQASFRRRLLYPRQPLRRNCKNSDLVQTCLNLSCESCVDISDGGNEWTVTSQI